MKDLPLRPGCPPACPGCAHRQWSAQTSEAQKSDWLRRRLAPWAERIEPIRSVAGEARWGYRDKVCLRTDWQEETWRAGLMRGDELIPIPHCPIHSPRINHTLQALLPALPPPPGFPLVYVAQSGAQVTLVLKTARQPQPGWLTVQLQQRLSEAGAEGLWLHLHPAVGRKIFTKPGWHLLWGEPRSRDAQGRWHGPTGFQQLIPALYEDSLDEAHRFLRPGPKRPVIDLYSGAGASLARWIAAGADALGVELGAEAVECVPRNAPGAEVLRGACAQRLPQLDEWITQQCEPGPRPLLYANPPRTGLEPEVVRWIAETGRPERMAYLSCSAGTLARDLERLEAGGLTPARIIPYDFFPNTYHVETLVLLAPAR